MSNSLNIYFHNLTDFQHQSLISHLRTTFADQVDLIESIGEIINLFDYGDFTQSWELLEQFSTKEIIEFENAIFDWDKTNEPNFYWV
jgi:hypothetical protein